MKKSLLIAASAAILASAGSVNAAEQPKEKCYGIAKAGKNDCGWAGGSCAGTTTKDGEKGAWLLVPKGLCKKLANGDLAEPKK